MGPINFDNESLELRGDMEVAGLLTLDETRRAFKLEVVGARA
jgi:hypothetical protein